MIDHPLRTILDAAARGGLPPADGSVTVLPAVSERDAGVVSFTGCAVVFADVSPAWVARHAAPGDVAAPLVLAALAAHTDRGIETVDLLAVAGPLPGEPQLSLTEVFDPDHPRTARAVRHRDDVRAWTSPEGGTVVVGRGVAGRWEVAIEVPEAARGRGLGRRLAGAGRRLVPAGEPVWAQVAPANAASVRALLAAGFTPVGAEALLARRRIE